MPAASLIVSGTVLAAAMTTAASSPVPDAVGTAFVACEQWLGQPATWSRSIAGFPVASGLARRGLRSQATVPAFALPPPGTRVAMHHWRVPVGAGGIFVTTSDRQPICHLVGGGPVDFAPGVAAVLRSPTFGRRWSVIADSRRAGLWTTRYRDRHDSRLTLIVSRTEAAGQRTDRAQFIATAQYRTGN